MICRVCGNLNKGDSFKVHNLPFSANSFSNTIERGKNQLVDLHLFECIKCLTVQIDADLLNNYQCVIRSSYFSPSMRTFRLLQIKDFIDRYYLKNKNILEIGCHRGEFLKLFNDNTLACFWGCEAQTDNNEKNIIEGFLGYASLSTDVVFDGFYSFNVFEHWNDWDKIRVNLEANCGDNAWGIIEVPNGGLILENGLYNEIINDHIYYFTPASFCNALELSGFSVLTVNTILDNYVLSAEVKVSNESTFDTFRRKSKIVRENIRNFFEKDFSNLVIWGAGHQSLATLSNLGSKTDKVDHLVDSSPSKINKYAPACNLKIEPPSIIKTLSGKITVLVLCGSFNSEIVNTILSWKIKHVDIYMMENGNVVKCQK